ncbi:MAG: ParB/RepB/Spo0J family partition protein [Clostridia bacterium]|nr:ParB/RepB/Spo0J family partition protein [Clostridia bacterium]
MSAVKKGLGRGLEGLFDENAAQNEGVVEIRLSEIEPNRNQPRKDFDEQTLESLAESIAEHGLIQPIVVRPTPAGTYQIVAGERRWRASRLAGLTFVPVVIKELSDTEYFETALIENLQREDLNAIEEAKGYKMLIDNYGLSQEQVAKSVGKARATVTNALRLLSLNEKEQAVLLAGKITAGHARALLSVTDNEALRENMLAVAIAGASVRELEKMAKAPKSTPKKPVAQKDTFYDEVAISLKKALHRKVNIKPKENGKGTITLEFYSKDELAEFARKLGNEER